MANPFVPYVDFPGWAPGIDSPPPWVGTPTFSSTIQLLTSVLMYGANGQAPTNQWRYDFDVSANYFWQGAPDNSALLQMLSSGIMYGVGGQTPSKPWHDDFDTEWTQLWMGSSKGIATILEPAPQTMFGAAGQGPSKQWRYDFEIEPWAVWRGALSSMPLLKVLTTQTMYGSMGQVPAHLWRYDFDVGATYFWQGSPEASVTLDLLIAGGNPASKQWRYDFDIGQLGLWIALPATSPVQLYLTNQSFYGSPGQAQAKLWKPDPEIAYPDGRALSQMSSAPLFGFTVNGEPFSKTWREDLSLTELWAPVPNRQMAWPVQFYGTQGPTKTWRWDHVPDPPWAPSPSGLDSGIMQILASGGKPTPVTWRFDFDPIGPPVTETEWLNAAPLNILVEGGPPTSKTWRWDHDPPPPWSFNSSWELSVPLMILGGTPFAKGWREDFEIEAARWSWPAPAVFIGQLPQIIPQPIARTRHPDFITDSFWAGSPLPTPSVYSIEVPPTPGWQPNVVPDSGWSWPAPPSTTAIRLPPPVSPLPWAESASVEPPISWIPTPQPYRGLYSQSLSVQLWRAEDLSSDQTYWTTGSRAVSANLLPVRGFDRYTLQGVFQVRYALTGDSAMPARNQNLTLDADRTASITIPITDQFGNPVSLIGATAKWALSLGAGTPIAVQKSTSDANADLVLQQNGAFWQAVITLAPVDTAALPPGNYLHELVVVDAAGEVVNITTGIITLLGSLNRY